MKNLQSLFEKANKIILFSSRNSSETKFEICDYKKIDGKWTILGGKGYSYPASTFLSAYQAKKLLDGNHTIQLGNKITVYAI